MRITINADGQIEYIHDTAADEAFAGLGDKRDERQSHVEPTGLLLRWLFHLIRRVVSDESRMAESTRRWRCRWRVRIFDGPTYGSFSDREEAIESEVVWLLENRL